MQDLDWVPIDVAATALQEMAFANEPVLHLVSTRPVPRDTIYRTIALRLNLPLVPLSDWLARVKSEFAAHAEAQSLLAFFRAEGSSPRLSTEKAARCAPSLSRMRPLDPSDAVRYLEFWSKDGPL